MKPLPLLLLLLPAACAPERPAPAAGAGAPVGPAADERYVQRDVCPFECCVYGSWKALAPLPVYAAETDTSRVAFRLAAGERFKARTGHVHLDPVGRALVRDTVAFEPAPGERTALLPGDTVDVLAPAGEGFFYVRTRGRIVQAPGFWAFMPSEGAPAAGTLLRPPAWSWWVRVEDAQGRTGWLFMDRHPGAVRGADACGGPEPE